MLVFVLTDFRRLEKATLCISPINHLSQHHFSKYLPSKLVSAFLSITFATLKMPCTMSETTIIQPEYFLSRTLLNITFEPVKSPIPNIANVSIPPSMSEDCENQMRTPPAYQMSLNWMVLMFLMGVSMCSLISLSTALSCETI